jgi:hypothetical protein
MLQKSPCSSKCSLGPAISEETNSDHYAKLILALLFREFSEEEKILGQFIVISRTEG